MSIGICSPICGSDEENKGRVQQSYREPCFAAQLRAEFSQWLSVLRKRAAADGARRRRGMHERYPIRLRFARRSTDLVANGGSTQPHAHAVARLRRTGPSSSNEGPLS